MRIRIQTILAAMRMVPLLRAIATEVKERSRRIASLEARLAALEHTRRAHRAEIHTIEDGLSDERAEMRRIERELARLGWSIGECYPQPVILRCKLPESGLCWQLDDSSSQRAPFDSAV